MECADTEALGLSLTVGNGGLVTKGSPCSQVVAVELVTENKWSWKLEKECSENLERS